MPGRVLRCLSIESGRPVDLDTSHRVEANMDVPSVFYTLSSGPCKAVARLEHGAWCSCDSVKFAVSLRRGFRVIDSMSMCQSRRTMTQRVMAFAQSSGEGLPW